MLKKIITASLAMAFLTLTSCEKLLDVEPTDKLSNEVVFSDVSGAKAALAGAYSMLLTTQLYHTNRMVYPDLVAGNIIYLKETNVKLLDVYSFMQDASTSAMNETYNQYYTLLNNVNNILTGASRLGDSTNPSLRRLEAEGRCLRALAHFDLLRLFARPYSYTPDASHAGVVINLKPRLYNDPLPIRSTAAGSYKAVTDDLEAAIRLFPGTSPLLSGGYTQHTFNAVSAEALLAKVYLYEHNWQQAYDHTDNVIRNGGCTLMTNQQYAGSWSSRTPSSESIFELALESNFAGTTLGNYYGDNSTELQYGVSPALSSQYTATDVRGTAGLLIPKTIAGTAYLLTGKYKGTAANATPVKVLRLTDMVLIRAEAAAHLENLTQAVNDLNSIRMRADAAAERAELQTTAEVINWIRIERRKEFAFEGEYFLDLMREKLSLPDRSFQDDKMVLPIPKKATDVNPSLEQNKGY